MTQSKPLPQFEKPPLGEVAFGIQFQALKGLRAAHGGIYWQRIRERYPNTEEQFPLAHAVEKSGLSAVKPFEIEQISIGPLPLVPRFWFVSETRLELVQIQNDRFHRNWRQIEGKEQYPRFVSLFKKFKHEWAEFLAMLEAERIGPPVADQCELIYINHIPQGEGWAEPGDVHKVIKACAAPRYDFLPSVELTSWKMSYPLPSERGRLHAEMKPGIRNKDRRPLIVLDMTARGAPKSSHHEDILAWFELAHEWIVRGFADLTTPEMHKLWGRNDGG